MTVRRRGGSWQVDITLRGSRYRFQFETEQEAQAWEHHAQAASLAGKPIPQPSGPTSTTGAGEGSSRGTMQFGEACDKAYAKHWVGTPSETTIWHILNLLRAHFGEAKRVDAITTEAVDQFVADCIRIGNSNGTINRKLSALSKVLKYARDRGALTTLPKLERKPEGMGRIRWLSREEETTLLALLRQWGREDAAEAVTVLIDTGLRNSELWRMTARDVDMKAGIVSIWKTKTGRPRSVPMTKRVKAIIEARMGIHKTGPLFPSLDNHALRYVWDRARTHMGLAGDDQFVPYVCRHTCASRLVQAGVQIPVVREWLGHTTIQMTMRYAHLAPHNLMAAVDALESDRAA